MFPVLITAGLLLLQQAESAKPIEEHAKPEPAKVLKKATPKPQVSETTKSKDSEEAEPEPKAASESPKPVPKPVRKRIPPPAKSDVQRRADEAEARAKHLLEENARLQQEMARAQGISFAQVTTPEAALEELRAGNGRFAAGKRVRTLLTIQDGDLRSTLSKGQAPFAVVITCSDSRLADNLIFDQELGRLFTVREAGNSPDIQGLASVEYAAEHLGSKLVVVMGHTSCGAVKAVAEAHGKPLPGHLWALQAAMVGLLETTPEDPNETTPEYLTRLASVNAQHQAQALLDRSEILRELSGAGKLKVAPAIYDLASGQVRFLEMPKGLTEKAEGHH